MATFGATTPSTGTTKALQPSIAPNDCNVPQPGNDGISSLCWSPSANILVSGNWDGGVRCWEIQDNGTQLNAVPKAQGAYKEMQSCPTVFGETRNPNRWTAWHGFETLSSHVLFPVYNLFSLVLLLPF